MTTFLAPNTPRRFEHFDCGEPRASCKYVALDGLNVTIERALTAAEADPEVGPMYRVRTPGGLTFDAFADELH